MSFTWHTWAAWKAWKSRVSQWKQRVKKESPPIAAQDAHNREEHDDGSDDPQPDDYPVFPPLSPRALLHDPAESWAKITARKFAAPQGEFQDSSLYALYRLYELTVLDKVLAYRNALEAFWRNRSWPVQDIPDPKDDDLERYAFLAGCAHLLVRSFNERVKLGLRRDMSSLLTPEEAEEARKCPDHLRPYEKIPSWAENVAPLPETLVIPTADGEALPDKHDGRADPDFLAKNILLWTPHISFT